MKRLEQGAAGLEAEAEWKEIPEFKQHWTGRQGTRNVRKIPSHHPASFIFVFAPPLSTQDQAPRRNAESIS